MKFTALIIALILALPSFGQRKRKDSEVPAIPAYKEGIVYSLPRTGIRVYVEAVCKKFVPGPYAAYAEQLLGIKDAKNTPSIKWTISNLKIETFSEPDPGQVYKALGDGASRISLAYNGCIAGINTTNVPGFSPKTVTNKSFREPQKDDGFSFEYFTDTPFVTEGDSTNNFMPVRITTEQKAAEAAQRVLNCRMNQYDLAALRIDGEYPDGKAYEVSLEELKRTEKNYITLFTGRTTYKKESCSFEYTPTGTGKNQAVIFRISNENGIVSASDLSGKPVMIEFEKPESPADKATSENPNAGESGVFYRIPGSANIKITYELNTLATVHATIAQFGIVAPVPENLLKENYSIQFHPETGAIKSVTSK